MGGLLPLCAKWLLDDLEPVMQQMADCRKEKEGLHLNQFIVELYGWSHLSDNKDARRYAFLAHPPVTSGVNEARFTSLTLSMYSLFFSFS